MMRGWLDTKPLEADERGSNVFGALNPENEPCSPILYLCLHWKWKKNDWRRDDEWSWQLGRQPSQHIVTVIK